MEVNKTYSIAYKGLKTGPHDYDFKVGRELFETFPATEIKGGDCDAHVHLERGETELALDIRITGSLVVACDRCLDDCRVPIDYRGRLLVRFSDQMREYDGEVMWLSPVESEVDLTQYLYESVVLALPYQRVHPEGECNPAMLERFRIVSGEEFAHIEAEAAQVDGALDAEELTKLSALKAKLESGGKTARKDSGKSGSKARGQSGGKK